MSRNAPSPKNAPAEIAKHLQRITHQHFFRTFEDWLALSINAFLRDDEAYMAIMRRYGPRQRPMGEQDHAADHFARALGVWMHAMQLEPADYFGRVYEEQAVANAYQGQFFTPEPVVELMAAMTMPDEAPDTAIVSDPACGSGRMLIAGIRRNRYATFLGTDTDLTCVHMATLNCLVWNANTYVIHSNSLSLETWGGYHVRRTPLGGELLPAVAGASRPAHQGAFRVVDGGRDGSRICAGRDNHPGAVSGGQSGDRRGGAVVSGQQAWARGVWVLT